MKSPEARQLTPRERVDYSEFFQRLIERRDELLNRDQTDRSQIEQSQTTGGAPGDEADISVIDTGADYFLRLADRDRRELLDIRSALEKLHRGLYGICEACGGEISVARLRNIPQTKLCVECQAEIEARQRVRVPRPFPKL